MLFTKHLKIVLNSNVGNINQKKADSLAEVFNDDFEVKIMQDQPIGTVFILANPSNREALVIEPNKVTYQIDSETTIIPSFDKIIKNVEKLYNTLLLDDQCTGLLHFVGSIEAQNGNSMSSSLDKFLPNQELKGLIDNLKGLGLRFLVEHHTGIWEYKVEPLINDPRLFFVEMICNVNKPLTINEIIELAREYHSDYTDRKLNVLGILGI